MFYYNKVKMEDPCELTIGPNITDNKSKVSVTKRRILKNKKSDFRLKLQEVVQLCDSADLVFNGWDFYDDEIYDEALNSDNIKSKRKGE